MSTENEYRSLTREDKLHNLLVTKKNVQQKIQNLQKQLADIDKKIQKYQAAQKTGN